MTAAVSIVLMTIKTPRSQLRCLWHIALRCNDTPAIGDNADLGQIGRDHHHRIAFIGEPLDQFVDLDDGADIDAARRLIENDQIRILHQRFGNRHFLLVAARQFDDLHVIAGVAHLERTISDITKSTRMIQNGHSLDRF